MTLHVQLVSPEQVLYEGEADMVVARTLGGGDIAFLTGHAPFLGGLDTWPVRVVSAQGEDVFAVHGGFVEVANDRVIILSDVAELAADVDRMRAEEAKRRAEDVLRQNPDDVAAAAAIRRADIRIQVAEAHA
jgi:F-type H+-transporting ATPase subunit epsilon